MYILWLLFFIPDAVTIIYYSCYMYYLIHVLWLLFIIPDTVAIIYYSCYYLILWLLFIIPDAVTIILHTAVDFVDYIAYVCLLTPIEFGISRLF